jgi:site-specific recombinase XerD
MEALGEYAMHGYIRCRRQMASRAPLPADLAMRLAEAVCFWEVQIRGSTLRSRRREVTGFLGFVASRGITIVGDIDPSALSHFVAFRCHLRPQSLAKELSDVRAFLRYLAERRLIESDVVAALPRVRVRRQGRIPSVWRDQDVTALLAAVDRGSPVGKRDYAILLLAARLGLRASDIKGLRLDHLRWEEARIEFNQSKTAIPLSLPLSEEIGSALIDHLRHGRPPSRYREVFLKVNAPIEPFGKDSGLYYIITKYRRLAGIQLPPRTRAGLHALRHTLASRLLELDTPLDHISAVMGHVDPETTRLYTKVDIKALREAALNPEEVLHA